MSNEFFRMAKEAYQNGNKLGAALCVVSGIAMMIAGNQVESPEGVSTTKETFIEDEGSDPTKPPHKAKRSYKDIAKEASGGQLPDNPDFEELSFEELCDKVESVPQSKALGDGTWLARLQPLFQRLLKLLFPE